jgi:hypothetical protein
MAERETQASDPRAYPAEKARQGRIVLRHHGTRLIFIAGLVAAVLLAIVLWFVR